ncbi:isochorismate synthase [Ureibacillus manganicus]|uniref:isochorismate synthase n=1 Tax=Ureibacillus manganicus DSM 26584 TaxID=1384049 RepID=A0A0A3HM03_9BACL|nr:isochorismate synthase [Ureibacillus manganicus]KGR73611.1 isochorismate synthase [Ureibacillus manganicus DSM 26584]
MDQKWLQTTEAEVGSKSERFHFYIETIEVNRLSALAFFAAGESQFKGKRFFWQNREKTFTLVGLGSAYVIENNENDNRFDHVEKKWMELTRNIVREDTEPQPILFGGFTFDPQNTENGEWDDFPQSYFTVATFQLVIQNDKAYVSIHLITDQTNSSKQFEELRKQRDHLIHAAQVKELKTYDKPVMTSYIERNKEQYLESVQMVANLIQNKQAEKVVIARSLQMKFEDELTSPQILSHVINEQPESYLFGLERNGLLFFGASPERLVKVNNGHAYSSCVAGSVKRGKTAEQDQVLGQDLLNDAKNLGEHQYVVDMIADTFSKNCIQHKVAKKPRLLKIRDIQHLFTPIEGTLLPNKSILQLVKDLHPTPALGGVPRQDALTIIRNAESMNRGLYAAPLGWIDAEGNGEFAVAIRSASLVDNKAILYAGGGIVAESEANSEYEETLVKFRPMLRALGGQLHE